VICVVKVSFLQNEIGVILKNGNCYALPLSLNEQDQRGVISPNEAKFSSKQ
jgi:hypothetical protein